MKQFSWVRQGLLAMTLGLMGTHSDAMSVRERYLQQHPQAQVIETAAAQPIKSKKHSTKKHHHEKSVTPVLAQHVATRKERQHHQPLMHTHKKIIKKSEVQKNEVRHRAAVKHHAGKVLHHQAVTPTHKHVKAQPIKHKRHHR